MAEIDKVMRQLSVTLDKDLSAHGCRNTGDTTEVGYFELRRLLDYVRTQRNNFSVMELLVADAEQLTEA